MTSVKQAAVAGLCGWIAMASVTVTDVTAATVVEDTRFRLRTVADEIYDPLFKIYVAPTQDDTTGAGIMFFDVESSSRPNTAGLVFLDTDLGGGSDWYQGDYGQVFSAETIAEGVFETWGIAYGPPIDEASGLEVPINQDLWFGVNTGSGSHTDGEGNIVPDRDLFGWVQLVIDEDLNVTMPDNAMAFGSGQIVLGRNVVPEPSGVGLMMAALVGLWSCRSRRRAGKNAIGHGRMLTRRLLQSESNQ